MSPTNELLFTSIVKSHLQNIAELLFASVSINKIIEIFIS